MAHIVRVLNILICSVGMLSWFLMCLGVILGNWVSIEVPQHAASVLGNIKIEQTIGLYEFETTECCYTQGQLVADSGVVCQSTSCTSKDKRTSKYCDFTDAKLDAVDQGSVKCGRVESVSSLSAALIAIQMVACVIVVPAFAFRKLKLIVVSSTLLVCTLLSIIVLGIYDTMVRKNLKDFFAERYGNAKTELGPSFELFIAAFVFQLCAAATGIVTVLLKRRKPPTQQPSNEPVELVMTPPRQNAVPSTNPTIDQEHPTNALPPTFGRGPHWLKQ